MGNRGRSMKNNSNTMPLALITWSVLARQNKNKSETKLIIVVHKRNRRQMACKPGSVLAFSERWPFLWGIRCRIPHATYPDGGQKPPSPSLFGLAPGGACRAIFVAEDAVRSYRTISTLPGLAAVGGLISVTLSLESPPPDIIRHRVSVEPGLSSSPSYEGPAAIRPSDAI